MKINLALRQARFYTILIFATSTFQSIGQTIGDYRSVASGNWTALSS